MTDHQRADTVMPGHPAPAPNMKRLAAEGLTFTSAYCPSPHCCPSRAAFHTGLMPSRSGVWNNIGNDMRLSWGLNEGVRCWAQDVRERGYETTFIGKWHVDASKGPECYGWAGELATGLGFEQLEELWDAYAKPEFTEQPQTRGTGQIMRPGYPPYTLYGIREQQHHDLSVTERAVQEIRDLASMGDPWCLFAGFTGPHDPYFVPQRYLDRVPPAAAALPPSYTDGLDDKPRIYQRMRRQIFGQLTESEVCEAIRHFWAYCAFLDDQLGQILEALEDSGQAEDTLVLFCSDHGDYCGDHGLFAKGIPAFRGAYRVPAIVRWPAGIASPGRSVDSLVSLVDFAPTFKEIAGCSGKASLSGDSLVPFFRGAEPPAWRNALLGQCNGVELYYTQRWVQTDRWRYVFNGFDFDELYDLHADPNEMRNLSGMNDYDTVKNQMARTMWRLARAENDAVINPYITVGLAPVGPGAVSEDVR